MRARKSTNCQVEEFPGFPSNIASIGVAGSIRLNGGGNAPLLAFCGGRAGHGGATLILRRSPVWRANG